MCEASRICSAGRNAIDSGGYYIVGATRGNSGWISDDYRVCLVVRAVSAADRDAIGAAGSDAVGACYRRRVSTGCRDAVGAAGGYAVSARSRDAVGATRGDTVWSKSKNPIGATGSDSRGAGEDDPVSAAGSDAVRSNDSQTRKHRRRTQQTNEHQGDQPANCSVGILNHQLQAMATVGLGQWLVSESSEA